MSGSSVLKQSYRDVIPVFLSAFANDYDCKDDEDELRKILDSEDVDMIMNSPPATQVYQLFWLLHDKEESIVEKFVKQLKINYEFLLSPIELECQNPSYKTQKYISKVNTLYNGNQRFSKYNVPRVEPHLKLQEALLRLKPSRNVVVGGALGAGKHWLALDVCTSFVVQQQMGFKIFWLDLRDCFTAESHLEELLSFLHRIAPDVRKNADPSVSLRIKSVQTELTRILKNKIYKNCLLVLRSVQNIDTVKAFNLGCKTLLTTRHRSVVEFLSTKTSEHIALEDALTSSEIRCLFAKYHSNEPHELPKELTTKKNLRQLSIIAESIAEGLCTEANWKHAELTTIIEKSLNVLNPGERQLYELLFIFPKSALIPSGLLDIVWSINNSISIANRFYEFSLVQKPKKNAQIISIPAIYYELTLSIPNEAELHKNIVDNYNIPRRFEQCNETTLANLDCYFFTHIGHHLSKLSNHFERVSLFRKVFLDFRFLDQKIRNDTTPWEARGSVLRTLQALKLYRPFIVDNDPHYEQLLNALLVFLPKVEEKLIKSKYTCLLRIALMAEEGPIHDEALRLAQQFPDYVWFTEHGRFHQNRQIINLGDAQVLHAAYLDNDYCLMALGNQQLLMTDVSLQGDATYRLSDKKDTSEIIEMRVFNKQNHILTLQSNGSLKLWSLREVRQAVVPAQAPKQVINNEIKRSINNSTDQKISAFYLDKKNGFGECIAQLHVAFYNGDICICDWNDKEEIFRPSKTPYMGTKQLRVRCFSKVLDKFYVLCTENCTLTVWNLRNGNNDSKCNTFATQTDAALSMETFIEQKENGHQYTILLLICKKSVWRLRFQHSEFCTIDKLEPEALQISDIDTLSITCGKQSSDGQYLILGTSEGLIVHDLKQSESVLRSNVSEHIVCLDIYDIKDTTFKYIVLCAAAGKNFLHVHTLRTVVDLSNEAITWVHHDEAAVQTSGKLRPCLEPNAYLCPILQKSHDETLFTIDTKSRIHQIQTVVDQRNVRRDSIARWATIATPQMEGDAKITALCPCKGDIIYAGYNNGKIMNVLENVELPQQYITEPIDYLKQISTQLLIASARDAGKTVILSTSSLSDTTNIWPLQLEVDTMFARLFEERHLLVFSERLVLFIDILNTTVYSLEEADCLVGFDLKQTLLFLAFSYNTIKVFNLATSSDKLKREPLCIENLKGVKSQINYLTASNDGGMLALALRNGDIQLYTYGKSRLQHIYTIASGHEPAYVMKLRFSPCKQVLVSCAEQLCFWNVKHMRNNQGSTQPLSRRHMHSRFGEESREEVDAAPWSGTVPDLTYNEPPAPRQVYMPAVNNKAHVWSDKRGNPEFPVLLACIKFVGNEARRFYTSANFTQFFVIDDEGVFYHLKVLEHFNERKPETLPEAETVRELDRVLNMRPTEELLSDLDVAGQAADDGVDVVGTDNTLPLKTACYQMPDDGVDVI